MKVYIETENKLYTIAYRYWQEGTSGFSSDGQWGPDFADELLGDTSLPLLPASDIHKGTREDLDAMLDFLHENAEAEKEEGHEWSVDVDEEPYVSDGWHDVNGGWVPAAVYEPVSDGLDRAGEVPFADFISGKYSIHCKEDDHMSKDTRDHVWEFWEKTYPVAGAFDSDTLPKDDDEEEEDA